MSDVTDAGGPSESQDGEARKPKQYYPYFSDPERAAEAGRRGAAARAEMERLKREDPEEYLKRRFGGEQGPLIDLLLDAAYGRNSFEGVKDVECPSCEHPFTVLVPSLPPDKRLGAITKALEWSIGRPAARKPDEPKQAEPPKAGLVVE